MTFREPTPNEVRDVLLLARERRTPTSTLAPGESPRGYLRNVFGQGAADLDNAEKKAVARRLRRGGISTSAIACILHLETVKTTVDRWVDDCSPETSIGLDGRIRRGRRKKKLPGPGPEPLDLTVEPPSYESVIRALLELRRAKVPVGDRPEYLRRYRGIEVGLPEAEIRRAARAARQCGFSVGVVSAIVGVPRPTVHRWVADIPVGIDIDIRGFDRSDGSIAEVLSWDAPAISNK